MTKRFSIFALIFTLLFSLLAGCAKPSPSPSLSISSPSPSSFIPSPNTQNQTLRILVCGTKSKENPSIMTQLRNIARENNKKFLVSSYYNDQIGFSTEKENLQLLTNKIGTGRYEYVLIDSDPYKAIIHPERFKNQILDRCTIIKKANLTPVLLCPVWSEGDTLYESYTEDLISLYEETAKENGIQLINLLEGLTHINAKLSHTKLFGEQADPAAEEARQYLAAYVLGTALTNADFAVKKYTDTPNLSNAESLAWEYVSKQKHHIDSNASPDRKKDDIIDFLFVGNSLIYSGEVPTQFERLCWMYGKKVNCKSHTIGGSALEDHLEWFEEQAEKGNLDYDYIVLQSNDYYGAAGRMDTLAKKAGATTILYRPYRYFNHAMSQTQATLIQNDGHPTDAGAYFTACLLASDLFDLHIKDVLEFNIYHEDNSLALSQVAWEASRYEKANPTDDISGFDYLPTTTVPDGKNKRVN